jgi:glyoxylase-like metal-dependent hydrolase (beta-lactamase superfamily II)
VQLSLIWKSSFLKFKKSWQRKRGDDFVEFYTMKKITDSTTQITDVTGVHCYLVEGSDRAALIDTAVGVGNLKYYVEKITDKPVIVLLTHGHCDHAGGAALFDEVYLSREDWALVEKHASMDMKIDYVRFCSPDVFAKLSKQDFAPVRTSGYKDLKDGQTFDLGGITLEAVAVPGHTHGMTCILNVEERSILFGDACNTALFIWDEEATSIEEYRESLLRLKTYEDRFDTVYMSHVVTTVDKKVLDGSIQVCEEIMNGKSDDQPFDFMGNQLKLAKKVDEHNNRLDGGLGNLVYNPDKIFKLKQ